MSVGRKLQTAIDSGSKRFRKAENQAGYMLRTVGFIKDLDVNGRC